MHKITNSSLAITVLLAFILSIAFPAFSGEIPLEAGASFPLDDHIVTLKRI
jgi:hypothetical protein